jgi:hypothetical protein
MAVHLSGAIQMKSIIMLAALLTWADAKEPTADPPAELTAAIDTALDLLAKKDYEQYLKEFAHPEDLEKILKTRTMDELVRLLAKGKAEKTITALKQVKDKKPVMKDSDSIAEYSVEVPNQAKTKMIFAKVGERWYLRN